MCFVALGPIDVEGPTSGFVSLRSTTGPGPGPGIGLGSTRPMLPPLSRSPILESPALESGPGPSIISFKLLPGSSTGRSLSGDPICVLHAG